MRVLLINLEFDCAGVAWHLRNALNNIPGWKACSVVRRKTPAAPDCDWVYGEIEDVVHAAGEYDILHFNNWIWTHKPGDSAFNFHPFNEWGEHHPFEKLIGQKQFVFHFHGGYHQLDPSYWIRECRIANAKMLKCDPISPISGAKWLPNILDINNVHHQTVGYSDKVNIAIHSDITDGRRNNKVIVESLRYLAKTLPITHTCFNSIPRQQALELRRAYNISIDNLTQGFIGMWGWESLAMGQVLLSRLDPRTLKAYEEMFDALLPMQNTTNVDEIGEMVGFYSKHPSALQQDGEMALNWAYKYYQPENIVRKYVDFYQA